MGLGVRALDISQGISGSYCTKLLAGFGGEVIKVERPGVGDRVRLIGPFFGDRPDPERGCLFHHLNTGKKSITLNLETTDGLRLFKKLVRKADIVVEDLGPAETARLGLGYAALRKLSPKIILASISPFGQEGPYRDYEATEITLEALGGYMHIQGQPDREPLKMGGYQAQYQAGLSAAVATMEALFRRDGTGKGSHLDVSGMECVASLLCQAPLVFHYRGMLQRRSEPRRLYRGDEDQYPATTLPCKDGYVFVHAYNYLWDSFVSLMQEPRLNNPEFLKSPRGHADEMDALILPRVQSRTREEVVKPAQAEGHPFAPVLRIDELCRDEHLKARNFFVTVDHPVMGKMMQLGAPLQSTNSPWETRRAPLLGEHNGDIYRGLLGLTDDELSGLAEREVI